MRPGRSLSRVLGVGAVFALASTAGLALHVDLPPFRRVIVARVDGALASTFAGRIVIERLERITATGAEGIDARVEDPDGRTVVRVTGVRARLARVALVRSLAFGGDLVVDLPDVSAQTAEVSLDAADDGALRLARAFALRAHSPGPATAGSPGRTVRVELPRVRIGRIHVGGTPRGAPRIDAGLEDVQATIDVEGGHVAVDVAHAALSARDLPGVVTAKGELDAHFAQPSPRGGDRAVRVSWQGAIGGVATTAGGSYDGGQVDAVLDAPRIEPERARALWPAWPAAEPAAAHLEAHGIWPLLGLRATVSVGRGALVVDGPVRLDDGLRASLRLDATSVDAHALSPAAPASDLDATGQAMIVARSGGVTGAELLLATAGGRLGAARVPAATLVAQLALDPAAAAPTSGRATLEVHEPGLPARLSLRLAPRGSSLEATFDAAADAPRLESAPRLAAFSARGRAGATAHGTVDLGTGRLDARVDVTASDLSAGAWRVHDAALTARASGTLRAPSLDADAQAGDVQIGALRLTAARARGGLELGDGATLRHVHLAADDGAHGLTADASLVRVTAGALRIDDAVVRGLGGPLRASLRASPGVVRVQARARGMELERIARLAGVRQPASGRLSLDVDAELRKTAVRGHVFVDLSAGSFATVHDTEAHLEAMLDGRRASGRLTARVGDLASIDAQTTGLTVGGTEPLAWSSWRRAWGTVDVGAHLDLARLAAQLPPQALPLAPVAGALDVHARVERESASDATPEVEVTAETTGLSLEGPGRSPWQLQGVNASARVRVDGQTGRTALDARVTDVKGALATLTATSNGVPYGRLFGGDRIADVLEATPFQAKVELPERDADAWPRALAPSGVHGAVNASVDFNGSLRQPSVDVAASVRRGRLDARLLAMSLDADLAGHYDGSRGDATLKVATPKAHVVDADVGVDVHAADLLAAAAGHGGPLPWRASMHARLTDFPLQRIGAVDDRQVRARATGEIAIERLHDDARASVALTLGDVQVGDVACRSAAARATLDGHALDATLRVDQADGYAEAHARAGAHWGAELVPALDASQPLTFSLVARAFRAELLEPFVAGVLAQIGGRVDADAKVTIDPRAGTVQPAGTIALRQGLFEVAAAGGEFHDASARLVLTPDGVVRLEDASARGLSGRLLAAATARIDAHGLSGLRADLEVPSREPLPLVLEGVNAGMVDGRIAIAADRAAAGAGLDVHVDLPTLHVQLPLSATHQVQALGPIEGVRIGVQRGTDFVPQSLDGDEDDSSDAAAAGRRAPLTVAVTLGRDVQVRRDDDLQVQLEGAPTFVLADTVRASGQIRILRGTILIQGKPFTIESGTVTFVGDDPSNPQVRLTATWTAPDETRIYADFVGPLKTGKVTLRSEPSLSKNAILALILFGTTDAMAPSGAAGTQQATNAAGAAGGAAGAAATQPINRALGGVNRMLDGFGLAGGISTKIDTSQATPRPEVELQIARDISLQVAWVLGVPPPGTNPDTTLFTISWHFLRKWSLQTTVGDAGTSILDLVWQHRY